MKSILDLCRELPASEPEIRERAREFAAFFAETCLGWQWRRSSTTGKRCLYAPGKYPRHMLELATGDEPLVFDWDEMPLSDPFSITDAKAATDAMIARGFDGYAYTINNTQWTVIHNLEAASPDAPVAARATASTEELARSACALLAAEALKKQ